MQEREQWEERIAESIVDAKVKKIAEMERRALQLKETREKERKQFVKDSLERRDGQEMNWPHSRENPEDSTP